MKRSIIFVVLCAMVIACLAPASVFAAAEPEVITTSYVHTNPLYEDFVFQKTLMAPIAKDYTAVYYDTISEAALVLRSGLENRDNAIRVEYATANGYSDDLHYQIFMEAAKHTGVPTQGDYLLWHYGGYRANVSYYTESDITYITFTYNMQYLANAQMEQEMDTAVDALLLELDVEDKTDYEKVCAVYDYICQNITYDYEGLAAGSMTAYTAYGALVNKTSVCQGYASLFYRLMLELDVDARVISGIGDGGDHGWNIVELSGLYYNLDSTWDAIYWEAGFDYYFFLRCDENFEEHLRDEKYASAAFYSEYPMADADFVPTQSDHSFSIADALSAANPGDTVSLTGNVKAKDLVFPSGVSLDLNGYTLTADSVLTYSSNAITDSSETASGLLKINDTDGNLISENNPQLPIYDNAAGGYRFFSLAVNACAVTGEKSGTPKLWFQIHTEKFAKLYDLICTGSEMKIQIKLTWDGQTEDAYAIADLAFLRTWADRYYENQSTYITVTVEEYQTYKNVLATPCVAANGVEIQSPEGMSVPCKPAEEPVNYPYNVTYEEYNAMSAEEQMSFYNSFPSHSEFRTWWQEAKKIYDDNKLDIEIGDDGVIDLGGILGGGQ